MDSGREIAVSDFPQPCCSSRLQNLEFEEPPGITIPVGAIGKAWIPAEKPVHILGLLDVIVGFLLPFRGKGKHARQAMIDTTLGGTFAWITRT
jgi:hypothetical protein